jgi:hypothetical protein
MEANKQLIEKLETWIEECQLQADDFAFNGMEIAEIGSLAMKTAYMQVLVFITKPPTQ